MGRGARHAAVATALPPRRGRGRQRRWSAEVIRRELRNYLAQRAAATGRRDFPTAAEMEDDGRHDLRRALQRYGGVPYWAADMGVPLRSPQDRRPYGADDAVAEAEEILSRLGALPNTKRLRELGYPRLSTFIMLRGGVRRFCAEHGLKRDR